MNAYFKFFLGSVMLFAICFMTYSCGSSKVDGDKLTNSIKIKLINPTKKLRSEVISINLETLKRTVLEDLQKGAGLIGQIEVETVDIDDDDKLDKVLLKTSIPANGEVLLDLSKDFVIEENKANRTQAELSIREGGTWDGNKYVDGESFVNVNYLQVPTQYTDHSYFIRYEGPGWENEQIGYRFYLDWRNAIDIFGKKVDTLVLQNVGQDGYDSYHEQSDWGMDVLKAGKSLGIGSIGQFNNGKVEHFKSTDSVSCEIVHSGQIYSSIRTMYKGWTTSTDKNSIISNLEIFSGDRAVAHTIDFDQPMNDFCTGIVKNDKAERIESLVGSNGWAYIATYGSQSLANDNLGLALIYNTKDVERISDSEFDHLVIFKPKKQIKYYLLGAWEQEKNGIRDLDQFKKYLNDKIERLNNPIEVSVSDE